MYLTIHICDIQSAFSHMVIIVLTNCGCWRFLIGASRVFASWFWRRCHVLHGLRYSGSLQALTAAARCSLRGRGFRLCPARPFDTKPAAKDKKQCKTAHHSCGTGFTICSRFLCARFRKVTWSVSWFASATFTWYRKVGVSELGSFSDFVLFESFAVVENWGHQRKVCILMKITLKKEVNDF